MCPIAGGNWNNGSNAGVWALNLNNARANSNTNVGARADFAHVLTVSMDTVEQRETSSGRARRNRCAAAFLVAIGDGQAADR